MFMFMFSAITQMVLGTSKRFPVASPSPAEDLNRQGEMRLPESFTSSSPLGLATSMASSG